MTRITSTKTLKTCLCQIKRHLHKMKVKDILYMKDTHLIAMNSKQSLSRRICTEYVDHAGLQPILTSRSIAIDKPPRDCPIGVGEVVRRIIGKAILTIIREDVLNDTGINRLIICWSTGRLQGSHTCGLRYVRFLGLESFHSH